MGHLATPAELAQAALDDDAQLARFRASIGRSCPGPAKVRQYEFNGRVFLPRPLLTYITAPAAPAPELPPEQPLREKLLDLVKLGSSGFAGVLPNGNVVDRRQHPEAIPIEGNALLGVSEPAPLP